MSLYIVCVLIFILVFKNIHICMSVSSVVYETNINELNNVHYVCANVIASRLHNPLRPPTMCPLLK